MLSNVVARAQAVKDFHTAQAWCEDRQAVRSHSQALRVAFVSPGPPGIGKSKLAVDAILASGGRLFEPSHSQAAERLAEARAAIRIDPKLRERTVRHVEGLGRRCLYLSDDEWSKSGWEFARVACSGCDRKQECPGMRQFWGLPDATFGVHAMSGWDRPNMLVIDEMPEPVRADTWDIDEVYRLCHPGWHPTVETWRRPIAHALKTVLDRICDAAYATPNPAPWGSLLPMAGMIPKDSVAGREFDQLIQYLDHTPIPKPPPEDVRAGTIRAGRWPSGNIDGFFRALDYEINGVAIPTRGRPETACVRVYGTDKGKVVQIDLEHRIRWTPPRESHVVLDSMAARSAFVYDKLYTDWDTQTFIRDVTPSAEGVELIHYETRGFARSRSLTPRGKLVRAGANARIRALRQIAYQAMRTAGSKRHERPTIGIIDHKAALEDMGFDFDDDAVLRIGITDKRSGTAFDPKLEEALCDLEKRFHIVVGYHGGVVGSNKFIGCRVLAILGDPYGHIGMLAEEARTLGVDPQRYVDWRVDCAALQEIYRARLLDTNAQNPKTVLFFGHRPPEVAPHLPWKVMGWREGGRIPSRLSYLSQLGLWSSVGQSKALFASLDSAVAGLHATLIGAPVLALREAGVIIDEMSHAARETYRRAVEMVANAAGWVRFSRPHPLGDRRALVMWAPDAKTADAALTQMAAQWRLEPKWIRQAVIKTEPAREAVEVSYEELAPVKADIDNRVKTLTIQRETARRSLEPGPERTVVVAEITRQLKEQLVRWDAIKKPWKERRSTQLLAIYKKKLGLVL